MSISIRPSHCMLAIASLIAGAGVVLAAQTPKLPPITQPPQSAPYRWRNVVIRGGGFVSGLVFSTSQKGLVYARTDVGGAYRSDDAGNHWISLSDQFSRGDNTYLGIESIATDPHDPNKVYIAAGMYSADWGGPSAIFRSNDKGRTLEKTPMPFKMGGNDNGRGVGERLAVDPQQPAILYFGSRKAGLWKSTDSAVSWSHVDSFPVKTQVTGVGDKTGITFVVFDDRKAVAGKPTQTIYAGVAQANAGLYRSDDAGATWRLVEGTPKDLFPNHAALSRGNAIYFSFADNVGPNDIHDGAIARLSLKDGKWKDVTPLKPGLPGQGRFGFGGLAFDAEHPDTLMATTIDRWWPGDTIFRSTDGGKSWKDIVSTAHYSAQNTPWVYWHKDTTGGRGWMSSIAIDPFDPAKVLYTTGEGIWGSANITAADAGKPTFWGFPNDGLEETVPLSIVSPQEGAHLLSGVGDIGGFRHDDLLASPKEGFFINPQLTTASSVDFAALAPAIVVRVGYGDAKVPCGGYSLDDGQHWKPFGTEPSGSTKGGGQVAISSDGKVVVWTPDRGTPSWSTNWGASWTACAGLTDKMSVVSDRVNPDKFYSFNPDTGQLLESLDKAHVFAARQAPVTGKGGAGLFPVTGVEGDLWILANDKVYHSTDSGVSFVTLEGMVKAYKMGFGMPAPGSRQPAIFINGIAAGQEGTFRSLDGGQSWVRIDDPEHQFGWKNAVVGDPRVFGRVFLATGGRGIVFGEPAAVPAVSSGTVAGKMSR
jgi:hypothetical protein